LRLRRSQALIVFIVGQTDSNSIAFQKLSSSLSAQVKNKTYKILNKVSSSKNGGSRITAIGYAQLIRKIIFFTSFIKITNGGSRITVSIQDCGKQINKNFCKFVYRYPETRVQFSPTALLIFVRSRLTRSNWNALYQNFAKFCLTIQFSPTALFSHHN
jgi:hypothetical protein